MRKSRCWRINIAVLRIGSLRIVVQGKRMQDFIKRSKYFAFNLFLDYCVLPEIYL